MSEQKVIINANLSAEQQEQVKATLLAAGFSMNQIVYENEIQECKNESHKCNYEHVTQNTERKKTFAEIIKEYGLNDEQINLLKTYSMERSRRAYEKVAAREIGNNELIQDWTYAGYYDSGYRGAEYCSAGHALRYVHIARNIKTGKEIKFGIVCVRDFFNLTDIQIKFIKNGFAEANCEIQNILDTYIKFNGDFDAYEKEFHYKEKLDFILEKDASVLKFDYDKLEHLFKLGMIRHLFQLKLPIASYYERSIAYAYDKLQLRIKNEEKITKVEYKNEEKEILEYLEKNHSEAYKIMSNLLKVKATKGLTDKQEYLLNKLLFTKWEEFDKIKSAYIQKTIKIKSFFIDAFNNIINSYSQYGGTEKQLALLKKAIQ